MARRNKRASMREGPLSDLFRSTADDAPVDPPEMDAPSAPGERPEEPASRETATPRYGREDPAEAKRAAEEARPIEEQPVEAERAREPEQRELSSDHFYDQEAEQPVGSENAPAAPERLKRVFAEEPRPRVDREDYLPGSPRYGREEPAYEPPGSGEPHQPVIKVVGVGGAGVNAVNRMVDARIPGIEFMAVNTDLQSLQLCVADVTVHIGDEQTRGLGAGADPEVGHRSAFGEQDKIKRLLKGSDMVFVAAGAG
ncbi:MAG: hypothetical protein AB7F97_16725, partial [Solirubrobacterales bacterium]